MKAIYLNQVFLIFLRWFTVVFSEPQCTWPSVLQNSTWLDSDKGTITFTESAMTGWTITDGRTGSQTISDWECFYQTAYALHSIVIYQAVSTVTFLEGTFRVFICMKLTEITSHSFYYYQQSAPDINYYDSERITVTFQADAATISSVDAESSLCVSDAANGPSDNEYHVLVRQGKETEVTQTCDSSFFGRYWYNVTGDETTWYCNETSYWDVCSDRTIMTFNYSRCPTVIAEANAGEVGCLFSLSTSSYMLQTVLTTSNTSNNFTCILSNLDGSTGKVLASLAPGSCKKDQTPDTLPEIVYADGTVEKIGQVVQLTPNADGLCPLTTTVLTSTTTTTAATIVETAAIVGGVLGSLAFIALIVILMIACKSWKVCKPCLSDKKESDKRKSGTSAVPRAKRLLSWKVAQNKEDKAKLKEEMAIESLQHKRIPHFIHEQPAMAPSMTALDQEGSNVVGKRPPKSTESTRSPKTTVKKGKLRQVLITPVETPDSAGKSSRASMSTMNSIDKLRNVSSVNLSVERDDEKSPYPMSRNSIVLESPTKASARSAEKLNESFNSESIGRVSSLSKYLNSTQETVVNSDVNTLDETVSLSIMTGASHDQELTHTHTTLGLKPILPISASESYAFESKMVGNHTNKQLSSSHRIPGFVGQIRETTDTSANQNSFTKRLTISAPPLPDNKPKASGISSHNRHLNDRSISKSFSESNREMHPNINSKVSSKTPSRTLHSENTISSQWTTVDEETITNPSLLTDSRSSNKSALKRRRHSKTRINSTEPIRDSRSETTSSQWTTVDEMTVSGSANDSLSLSSKKPTYKKYRNSNLSRQSRDPSRNLNSQNTDSSQWTTVDEETLTNSSVLSKPSTLVSAYRPPHHQSPHPADTNSISSTSTKQSNTYSCVPTENNNQLNGILKPTTKAEKPVVQSTQVINTEYAQAQGTQTDMSSLEVFFQAHGYPEQVCPKSVKTGLYYISDSPLAPIAEAVEQTSAKEHSKQKELSHDYKNDEPITCMKLYSENTFSSQWETVDEETVTESDSTDDPEVPTPAKYKQNKSIHATLDKPIGAADTIIPFQRVRTYNGYEPDSD